MTFLPSLLTRLTRVNGGCPKDRFIATPDAEPGLHYLCAGYKAFFQHIDSAMETMADLLRRRRPAADILRIVADQDRGRIRNSPCPCNGGRKWKPCHGVPTARFQ